MKTLQEIEKLISDDRNEAADIQKKFSQLDEDQRKNALRRIKKLKQNISYHEEIKKYLLSSPSKEWLEKEEERLRNRLQKIAEGYKAWSDQNKRPFDNEAQLTLSISISIKSSKSKSSPSTLISTRSSSVTVFDIIAIFF